MTKLEQMILETKTEGQNPEAPSPLTFGDLIGAIVEDLHFIHRRLNNTEVALAKTLKELQRVKNKVSYSEGIEISAEDLDEGSIGAALLGQGRD